MPSRLANSRSDRARGRRRAPGRDSRCRLAAGGGTTHLTAVDLAAAGELAAGSQPHERAGWNGPAPLSPLLAAGSNALAPYGRGKGRDTPRHRHCSKVGSGRIPSQNLSNISFLVFDRSEWLATARTPVFPGNAVAKAVLTLKST